MKLLLIFMCACLCSCVVADGSSIKALGGKGAYRSNAEGGFTLVWNAEKSFYHGTVLAGTLAASAASAYTAAATEATARHAAEQGTKQHAATQATQQLTTTTGAGVVKHANGANTTLEIPAQIVTPKGY
jgi:hypothetical protein